MLLSLFTASEDTRAGLDTYQGENCTVQAHKQEGSQVRLHHSPSPVKLFQYFTPFNHVPLFLLPPCARSRARKYPLPACAASPVTRTSSVDFVPALFFLLLLFFNHLPSLTSRNLSHEREEKRGRKRTGGDE